jgi:hypothetical protein
MDFCDSFFEEQIQRMRMKKNWRKRPERPHLSIWLPCAATWIVCCVRIFPELKSISSSGMMNGSF